MRKLLGLIACLALATGGATFSATAQAQTASFYFISICTVPAICSSNPVWFGPFVSWEQCDHAWNSWSNTFYGQPPRVLSNCYSI